MLDLVGNPEDRFSRVVAHIKDPLFIFTYWHLLQDLLDNLKKLFEPPRGKTNNVVSEQV